MEPGTGIRIARLLGQIDGLEQKMALVNREIGSLEGAEFAFTELAPSIRKTLPPEDCEILDGQRRIRNLKIEELHVDLRELSQQRDALMAEFLQLIAKM